MGKKIRKELPELVSNSVITQEVADKIDRYYASKVESGSNRLLVVFGVLGATLVGLGIILILAHNWDEFPRAIKTSLAFLPLVLGQCVVGYSIVKQKGPVWKEASGTFLFFAVGSSISLISQIYNIPGNLSTFLLTWVVLCIPLIYVLKSKALLLLHLVFTTYYACNYGYSFVSSAFPWNYLPLILVGLPFYYQLLKKEPGQNMTSIFNWIIPLSLTIVLGTFLHDATKLWSLAYMMLFGLLYNIGKIPYFEKQKLRQNGFLILGSLGTIAILLSTSFKWAWKHPVNFENLGSVAFFVSLTLLVLGLGVLSYRYSRKWHGTFSLYGLSFILFAIVFFIGLENAILSATVINILVLALGLNAMQIGARKLHFGILNYGLLIITSLVICRFFDTDMSFVIRGLLFLIVGLGFFLANYFMLKKSNKN